MAMAWVQGNRNNMKGELGGLEVSYIALEQFQLYRLNNRLMHRTNQISDQPSKCTTQLFFISPKWKTIWRHLETFLMTSEVVNSIKVIQSRIGTKRFCFELAEHFRLSAVEVDQKVLVILKKYYFCLHP